MDRWTDGPMDRWTEKAKDVRQSLPAPNRRKDQPLGLTQRNGHPLCSPEWRCCDLAKANPEGLFPCCPGHYPPGGPAAQETTLNVQQNPIKSQAQPSHVDSSVSVKIAWPLLRGMVKSDVRSELISDGVKKSDIFVWGMLKDSPPSNRGTDQSIWLYLFFDDIIYHIPKRGPWQHPNRVDVGWPNLVGVKVEDAIAQILEEVTGVTVEYLPNEVQPIWGPNWDRVFLYGDKDGRVAVTPTVR